MIKILLLISILIFIIYIIITISNKNENIESIYNKKCVLKRFKEEIDNYEINNLLLKINILQPIIFNLYPMNDIETKFMEIYKKKKKTEKFRFSDGCYTRIDYLLNNENITGPILYFTNTFGVDGFGIKYIHRIMLELNKYYNCIFIYNRGYDIPINNKRIYLCNINEDMDEILNYLTNKFKINMHILVGISMGANNYCTYLCSGASSVNAINGFISIYNPLDLVSICYSQTYSLINNYIINKIFKNNMKKYLLKNFAKNKEIKENIDIYLKDLDLFYNKFIKKYSKKKYNNFSEYCYNNSCINVINKLEIPSLFVFANDDCVTPISIMQKETLKKNKYIYQIHSKYGSHVGHYDDDGDIWIINLINKYVDYLINVK